EDTPHVQIQLITVFGKEVFENQKLNRQRLAQLVFRSPKLLHQLNAIVHPALNQRFLSWVNLQNSPYVVQEAALIFETKAHRYLDKVVGVIAPEKTRIERVLQRDNTTVDEIKQRIIHQLSNDEIIAKSDYVIMNDGKQALLPQILQLYHTLLAISN
ncbi:MAG: dephospho-CoA kinase, partial [Bacteroidales bacterium]